VAPATSGTRSLASVTGEGVESCGLTVLHGTGHLQLRCRCGCSCCRGCLCSCCCCASCRTCWPPPLTCRSRGVQSTALLHDHHGKVWHHTAYGAMQQCILAHRTASRADTLSCCCCLPSFAAPPFLPSPWPTMVHTSLPLLPTYLSTAIRGTA
jgi:hypothetical protein